MLTADEKRRNTRGTGWTFRYANLTKASQYPSPLPSVFPPILACYSVMQPFTLAHNSKDFVLNRLCPDARLGESMLPGFPSIYTIPFTSSLGYHGVNVFNSDSKSQSHVISI